MAKIIKGSEHVPQMRQRALRQAAFWILLMLLFLVVGLLLNKGEKKNAFTIIAIVCSLPIAQYVATFFGYTQKTVWDGSLAEQVAALPDCAQVFLNAIAVTEKKRIFFDYIIIIGEEIYLFSQKEILKEELASLEALWLKKGIDCPMSVVDRPQWQRKIEELGQLDFSNADAFIIGAVGNMLM